jgi:hypothetical protein
MKLSSKDYKILKIKNFIKNNNLFFFFNGINPNSNNWIHTEQELQKIRFNYYKVFNKTSKKILEISIYKVIEPTINGVTYFIKPLDNNKELTKHLLINNLGPLLFTMLIVKFNNKAYTAKQFKNTSTLNYEQTILSFYQYGLTNIKSHYAIKSK